MNLCDLCSFGEGGTVSSLSQEALHRTPSNDTITEVGKRCKEMK